MRTRWEHQFVTGRLDVSADGNFFHVNRRFSVGPRQVWEDQHRKPVWGRNPELAVTGKIGIGETKTAPVGVQAVSAAERRVIERLIVTAQSLKAAGREPVNAVSAKPQFSFHC